MRTFPNSLNAEVSSINLQNNHKFNQLKIKKWQPEIKFDLTF